MSDIGTEAAQWLVRLSDESAPPSEQDFEAFERWQQADPRHREAVNYLQGVMGTLHAIPAEAAKVALEAGKSQRTQTSWQYLTKTLSIVMLIVLPLYLIGTSNQAQIWLADKRTNNNEWHSWTLQDDSTLYLSGNSAVDIEFDSVRRSLSLLQGDLLIDVAKDADRPLYVIAEHGRFVALGTRFIVQRKADSTVLTVLESQVSVLPANDSEQDHDLILQAGEQVSLDTNGPKEVVKLVTEMFESRWLAGQYVVDRQPLNHVLAELARYHKGKLIYDSDSLAHIQVMAVLPLDDPERAIQLLSESLPIKVSHYTPWVVHISSR